MIMWKKIILGIVLVACLSSVIFAAPDDAKIEAFESFTDELDAEISSFVGQELPGAISPFINDETLEVTLIMDSGEELKFIFVIEDSVIIQAGQGDLEEPGYELTVSQEFVEANQGDSFGKAVRDGLTTGEVFHEANGFWRKVKLSVMLAAVDIAALFQ